ncbi:MAG: calcium/sodium antiporter [Planctomycetes bacterium]|nr:calcium/sodium antiporter [Planctomycetota bacterium]
MPHLPFIDFNTLPMAVNLLLVVASILLLWKGADKLVESAAHIARRFGVSDLVIGLTIVAFGTSAPEFAVSINAAINGKFDISVSNIVGSNIFNLGIILGGCALFRALPTSRALVWRDGLLLLVIATFLGIFLYKNVEVPGEHSVQNGIAVTTKTLIENEVMTAEQIADVKTGAPVPEGVNPAYAEILASPLVLSRLEGGIFLAALIFWLFLLFIKRQAVDEDELPEGKGGASDYFWLLVGLAAVVGGGHLLVESASAVARSFGISEWVIGVTIVAAGTSAPEVATSFVAVIKKRYSISIGNLIGSDIFNQLGVLGLAAVINPLVIVEPGAMSSVITMIFMIALTIMFMRTGWKVRRWEGGILIGINLVRWVLDFSGVDVVAQITSAVG